MRCPPLPFFLLLLGLPGCIHDEADRTPKIPVATQEEATPRELAEYRVVYDISSAQRAERENRPGRGPEDTIVSVEILSATGRRNHIYANVHALRRDIKRRLDSLKAAGSAFKYDTTYQGPLHRDSTAVFIPQ